MVNSEPIVKINKVKRPGHKKRVVNGIITISIFILILLISYFVIKPADDSYTLKSYDTATVTLGDLNKTISINGTIDISSKDTILSPERSICTDILKKAGEKVTKGEIILKLNSKELEENLSDLEDELKQVERNSLKKSQDFKRGIRDINREIVKLEDALIKAEEEFEKYRELYDLESITLQELENSKEKLSLAKEEVDSAKIRLDDLMEDKSLEEELTEYDSKRAKAKIKRVEEKLDSLNIRSKISGTILGIPVKKGDNIEAGTIVARIGDLDTPYVNGDIPLNRGDEISVGQRVNIKIDRKSYSGEIRQVNAGASVSQKGESILKCEISLDEAPETIIPGTSIGCEVIIMSVEDKYLLKRGEFLVSGNNRYLYVIDGEKAIKTEVDYGILNSSMVAIESGVSLGDEVIVSDYYDFIDKKEIYLNKEEL